MRIAVLTFVCLAIAVVPGSAQTLYSNGPINGTIDLWNIYYGHIVSDSFTLSSASTVGGFDLGVWEFPGDKALTVDWSITALENGGTLYGSGTAHVTDTFISTNQYGYDIDSLKATGLNVSLGSGTYWLNLQNTTSQLGDGVFWDENDGKSLASDSLVGTIGSESFEILGGSTTTTTTPEPSSILLFGSGILSLAGVLRRGAS